MNTKTQAKHMPGPWKLIEKSTGDGEQENVFSKSGNHWRYGISSNHTLLKIANAMGWTQEEALANAHLIAAAPELLGALKAIARHAEATYLTFPNASGRYDLKIIEKYAIKAIAKAEGE